MYFYNTHANHTTQTAHFFFLFCFNTQHTSMQSNYTILLMGLDTT